MLLFNKTSASAEVFFCLNLKLLTFGPILNCPLCNHSAISMYYQDHLSRYHHCLECDLVFLDPKFHLDVKEEKKIYDQHENALFDEGYRKFLSKLFNPLLKILPPNQTGLDFGAGPGPFLAKILEDHGHTMKLYDPYYHPHKENLKKRYDFIVSTEVFEHFYSPGKEISSLKCLLRDNGILGIMTKLNPGKEHFKDWYYRKDETHVCFYSTKTMNWLADFLNMKIIHMDNNVIIFSY